MNTLHLWFRSGSYSLLGHIDVPLESHPHLGVVIVPPFGWEDVCSYRPLRFLGQTLAENGIPTLRYDLPGTGDSAGDAGDSGLFEAWIQSIGDAAAELERATGVREIAVIGIRLGGMLALIAASRGLNVQDMILWGPSATGRAVLRELRVFASAERRMYNNEAAPPVDGFEVGGFVMSPQTLRSLEALDVAGLEGPQGKRIMILSRDDLPADSRLVAALEAAQCSVEVKDGPGYASMTALPHEATPPQATATTILEFLTRRMRKEESPREHKPAVARRTAVIEQDGCSVTESIHQIGDSPKSMFGILAEPDHALPRAEWCALFLNAGGVRHIGPNRMWVQAARRWAARGVVSLRVDLLGIGESDGQANRDGAGLYEDRLVELVERVMDSLRSRAGAHRFAAIGLCSGAFWAFQAAIRNRDIRAAILLNPRLFYWDPEVDPRRVLRRSAKALTNPTDWRRLATGDVEFEKIKRAGRIAFNHLRARRPEAQPRQLDPERMAAAWTALDRNGCRLTLIFSEDEPLLSEMVEEGQLPPETCSRIQCIRTGNAGHTFSPMWAQRIAHQLVDRELDAMLESPLDCVAEAT